MRAHRRRCAAASCPTIPPSCPGCCSGSCPPRCRPWPRRSGSPSRGARAQRPPARRARRGLRTGRDHAAAGVPRLVRARAASGARQRPRADHRRDPEPRPAGAVQPSLLLRVSLLLRRSAGARGRCTRACAWAPGARCRAARRCSATRSTTSTASASVCGASWRRCATGGHEVSLCGVATGRRGPAPRGRRRGALPRAGRGSRCSATTEYTLGWPSLLEVVRWLDEQEVELVVLTTPGPVGLVAMLAARILGIATIGQYHTNLPSTPRGSSAIARSAAGQGLHGVVLRRVDR